jgi:hypothetical protein
MFLSKLSSLKRCCRHAPLCFRAVFGVSSRGRSCAACRDLLSVHGARRCAVACVCCRLLQSPWAAAAGGKWECLPARLLRLCLQLSCTGRCSECP